MPAVLFRLLFGKFSVIHRFFGKFELIEAAEMEGLKFMPVLLRPLRPRYLDNLPNNHACPFNCSKVLHNNHACPFSELVSEKPERQGKLAIGC